GGAFMAATALIFLAVPTALARVYATDPVVVATAASLIPLAGVFQVFDGLQVVATGVLRGVGDTRAPLVINVFGFLLVGMPISVYLGLYAGGGPRGLWWGIVVGLAAVALILALRVRRRLRGELSRLVMDDALPSPAAAALARPIEVLEGEM
ncbi:MAG: MATE family efflux transporter, partial [Gemmatimonadaceae bacterium]